MLSHRFSCIFCTVANLCARGWNDIYEDGGRRNNKLCSVYYLAQLSKR